MYTWQHPIIDSVFVCVFVCAFEFLGVLAVAAVFVGMGSWYLSVWDCNIVGVFVL